MKNLLITGGCGFIGSNFINYIFTKNKYNIINIDAMYYCANEKNINNDVVNSNMYHFIKGNICDYNLVFYILNTHKIDMIVHFAAQSHVQNSFDESIQFTNDNVLGTHTLLEACRKYGKIVKFVHVSTDEVYGESFIDDPDKKTEQSILCPTNPYAATKAGAELLVQSYYHSFKLPVLISRGNNVFGKNQYPEKVIPKFISSLKENKKITIQGNGNQMRSFLHINDTVNAFEILLENGKIGEIYNIGCDHNMEYTIIDVAKILINTVKNTNQYDLYIEYIEDRPFNDRRYFISNDKIKKLGWEIECNFLDEIKKLALDL